MASKYALLLILALSPVVALAMHMVFSRLLAVLRPGISNQLVCILSVAAANAPVLALVWYASCRLGAEPGAASTGPTLLYALLVHNALGYSYFHVFNMSETARRIRILYDLSAKPSMDLKAFTSYYDTGGILEVRVERLVKMGSLKKVDQRYVTSGRTLLYATRLIDLWGRLIGSPLAEKDAREAP